MWQDYWDYWNFVEQNCRAFARHKYPKILFCPWTWVRPQLKWAFMPLHVMNRQTMPSSDASKVEHESSVFPYEIQYLAYISLHCGTCSYNMERAFIHHSIRLISLKIKFTRYTALQNRLSEFNVISAIDSCRFDSGKVLTVCVVNSVTFISWFCAGMLVILLC